MSSNNNAKNNAVYTSASLINMLPSEPSVCVPRIYMNISKERVYNVFADLFGHESIERVDLIERENKEGESYKRAFIHFKFWPRTEQSTEVRLKLLNGDEVKVVYDQPWYWRISASRHPRPDQQQPRRNEKPSRSSRPFIMIDEEDDEVPLPYQQRRREEHVRIASRPPPPAPHKAAARPQQQQYHSHSRHSGTSGAGAGAGGYYYERNNNKSRNVNVSRRIRYEEEDNDNEHSENNYQRRINKVRPSNIYVTPTKKEPEIALWIEKAMVPPGAPVKGRKPCLVMEDDATTPTTTSFDETPGVLDDSC
jgi:hypothetical protein